MAIATCRACHQSANASTCPNCGGLMIADEIFAPEEGGAFPQFDPKPKTKWPVKTPSFFPDEHTGAERPKEMDGTDDDENSGGFGEGPGGPKAGGPE